MCTDNYFTIYSLAQQLLQQSSTLFGTIRQHRREIPLILRAKADLYSSRFLFNQDDGISSKEKENFGDAAEFKATLMHLLIKN